MEAIEAKYNASSSSSTAHKNLAPRRPGFKTGTHGRKESHEDVRECARESFEHGFAHDRRFHQNLRRAS